MDDVLIFQNGNGSTLENNQDQDQDQDQFQIQDQDEDAQKDCLNENQDAKEDGGEIIQKDGQDIQKNDTNNDDHVVQKEDSKDQHMDLGSTEKDEFFDKFIAYCRKFKGGNNQGLNESTPAEFRLTDLLQWFIDDECHKIGPLTYQKLLLKLGFTIPSSICLPPSRVVDLLVESPSELSLKDVSGREAIFGKFDQETLTHKRQFYKYPAPNMTRFLYDIGYDLASEVAYRNALSEVTSKLSSSTEPGVLERHTQIVEDYRRLYEEKRKANQPFKLKTYRCPVEGCNFVSETQLQLHEHRRRPHKEAHRWLCALCNRFSSWDEDDIEEHYNFEHGFTSSVIWEPPLARAPCPLCDQDFKFKGQLQSHLRTAGQCLWNSRRINVMPGHDSLDKLSLQGAYSTSKVEDVVSLVASGKADLENEDVLNLQLWPKIDELRTTNSLRKPAQLQQNALQTPSFRMDGAQTSFYGNTSTSPRNKVADVVSMVASGKGELRSPVKPNLFMPSLPRLPPSKPSVLLKTNQTIQHQLLQQQHNQQQRQQLFRQLYFQHSKSSLSPAAPITPSSSSQVNTAQKTVTPMVGSSLQISCEICDEYYKNKLDYLKHLQLNHRKFLDKPTASLIGTAPLACSRCRDRFYSYEGLERHLLMEHDLVTNELLNKAQRKQDSGKCKICMRIYAFNLLQHLVQDHSRTLCSAEIVYSCDVCQYRCNSYIQLENHLRSHHADQSAPRNDDVATVGNYAQAVNALSSLIERERQQQQRHQGPPRSTLDHNSNQAQTAAAVLNAALGTQKRPLAASSAKRPTEENGERPPKLARMTQNDLNSAGTSKSVSARLPTAQNIRSASNQQMNNQTNKKQLRYCCTPCDLKFISYEAVLKHWVERHLQPLRVPLCRIDQCEKCKKELTSSSDDVQEEVKPEDGNVEVDGKEKIDGNAHKLTLDFEFPELGVESKTDEDEDVQVLPSPPKEVIFLD